MKASFLDLGVCSATDLAMQLVLLLGLLEARAMQLVLLLGLQEAHLTRKAANIKQFLYRVVLQKKKDSKIQITIEH